MATTDSDEQSLFDRGRERLRDATRSGKQGVKKATDTFTGKALEDSIAEHNDDALNLNILLSQEYNGDF